MSSVSCSYQTSTNEIRGKIPIPIPIPSLIAVKIQLICVPKGHKHRNKKSGHYIATLCSVDEVNPEMRCIL